MHGRNTGNQIHLSVAFIAFGLLLTNCNELASRNPNNAESSEKVLEQIQIRNENLVLKLIPEKGGSIHSLSWNGIDILRPMPEDADDIVDVASFPLVPIVNRIPDGEFEFESKKVDLDGNFMGLPDFIHGHGWKSSWQVISQSNDKIILQFDHSSGKWPWSYTGQQTFELSDNSLSMELSVTNTSSTNMPADIGFHPYFPTTSNTKLQFQYDGYWSTNDKGHALEKIPGSYRQDFTKGADLIDPIMTDQTHYGYEGRAVLSESGRPDTVITSSENITNLHVFFPPNGNYAAIEPTLGRGNPFGTEEREINTLAPNETLSAWMKISVEP
ncbi:aldose 1-epimerase [Hirschia maritima]|uniref:aldose 1-epimerase n=1 Tax=Hirschia maritima TaxID=1121961 RepID=UPI00036A1652|nr:aldose 1-epimerase [Hirschia maritima]